MLTSYITTRNLKPLSSVYTLDNQLNLHSNRVTVDGNLDVLYTPLLSANKDFTNNNYSLLSLTDNIDLESITDFKIPENKKKIYFGLLGVRDINGIQRYLEFSDQRDDILTDVLYYDQTFNTPQSALNDLNFFEFDLTEPSYCTISKLFKDNQYYLCYDPTKGAGDTLNLNFVVLSAFNPTNDETRKFCYNYDEKNNLLTLQVQSRNNPYILYRNNRRLDLTPVNNVDPIFTTNESVFLLSAFQFPGAPEITVEWGSYNRTFNQNNIDINILKSYYHLSNNFLLNREYYNLNEEENKLPFNILTLKNQLNINNDQGRGNIFPDEFDVNYREYSSIFSGGNQEKGFLNLQLGYDAYSTPYTFKQGQTTWFHMPQDMYPYKKLNVKASTLVRSGAIAGDHPLRSDKIFKKIANYRNTSPQGNSTGEKTGQWLCTWLSGGPSLDCVPVWVDRYYTPSTTTPYQALSARPSSITITTSYDCLDLPEGVYDAPSSLVFEPGCWYAYSHIGKSDALQFIKNSEIFLQQKDFLQYEKVDGSLLDPFVVDGVDTYKFTGNEISYFETGNIDSQLNAFTFSFWGNSNDWAKEKGYEIAGNYNDYGLGIFNYNFVTPLIFFIKQGKLLVLNKDLELLTTYDTGLSSFGNIVRVFRRDALNTFHALTDNQALLEFDLKETLVDATYALSGTQGLPKFATNDESNGILLYNNNTYSAVNLFSNLTTPVSSTKTIGDASNIQEIRRLNDGSVVTIAGSQSQVYGNGLYFLSAGNVYYYNTATNTLTAFIGDQTVRYSCFCIDKNSNTWVASANQISIYNSVGLVTKTITLTADADTSTQRVNIKNITFLENFDAGNLVTNTLISASGSEGGNIILYKLNDSYDIEKIKSIQTNSDLILSPDPSNHVFNYSYLKNRYSTNGYTFKIRLYNPLDNEDIEIPQVTVDSHDLNGGYHHFAIVLNCRAGTLKLYLDGSIYRTASFTPQKYNFTKLLTNTIFVGATPYYGGLLLYDYLDKGKVAKTSYTCKGFEVQYFYLYNKELDYFDINMLYKQKMPPKDLVWDVPSGKRSFIDSISRFFKQKIPGAKSGLFNIWINSNLLSEQSKQLLEIAIQQKVKEITPAYSKLNKINWFANNPSVSGDYVFPYFPGNTLTTGALQV